MDAQERARHATANVCTVGVYGEDEPFVYLRASIAEEIRQAEQAVREKALAERAHWLSPAEAAEQQIVAWNHGVEAAAMATENKLGDAADSVTGQTLKRVFDEMASDIRALKDKP